MDQETSHSEPGDTLVYDGQCRLCVTAKETLERLESGPTRTGIRMIPYQSDEAKCLLGQEYRPGRPEVAYLITAQGQIRRGVDAFLPLLPGLKGGGILTAAFRNPLVKSLAYLFYPLLARWRYRLFGEVSLGRGSTRQDGRNPPASYE